MAHPAEELNPAKKSALGKKFFVILAFLLVLGMLLLLISFAKYRKKINGEIRMPEAMKIQATLTLDKNLSAIESQNLTTYLADLQPGDEVRNYLAENDSDHKIVVTITNHGVVEGSEESDERTELTLHYKLYVDTTDHLPLEFIMVDEQGQKYIAQKTGSRYCFYPLNIDNGTETAGTTEAEFAIDKTDEDIAQEYTIYVGWDNRVSGADDAAKLLSAQNADYRKEVEMLTLRAEIVAETAGVGYEYASESDLKGTITAPVSEP